MYGPPWADTDNNGCCNPRVPCSATLTAPGNRHRLLKAEPVSTPPGGVRARCPNCSMGRVEWSALSGDEVETVLANLIYNEDGRAIRIRPSQGDYGIDIIMPGCRRS